MSVELTVTMSELCVLCFGGTSTTENTNTGYSMNTFETKDGDIDSRRPTLQNHGFFQQEGSYLCLTKISAS